MASIPSDSGKGRVEFNDPRVQTFSIFTIIDQIEYWLPNTRKHHTTISKQFLDLLRKKLKGLGKFSSLDSDQEDQTEKSTHKDLQSKLTSALEELTVLKQEISTKDTIIKDQQANTELLEQKLKQQTRIIKEHETSMPHLTNQNESTSGTDSPHDASTPIPLHKVKDLRLQLTNARRENDKLRSDFEHQNKQLAIYEKLSVTREDLMTLTKDLFQQASHQQRFIEDNLNINDEATEVMTTANSLPQRRSYASTAATINQRTPQIPNIYSKAAILLRRRSTTKLNAIRAQLTNIVKDNNFDIYCDSTRDKNCLLIKTRSDERTQTLYNELKDVTSITDLCTITFKDIIKRKVLITGIPLDSEPTDVTEKLKLLLPNSQFQEVNHLTKAFKNSYQIVFDFNLEDAIALIKMGKFPMNFTVCNVRPYLPILRCARCQTYGHIQQFCTKEKPTCGFCGQHRHETTNCPFKEQERMHRCTNCCKITDSRGNPSPHQHAALSAKCPVYKDYLKKRNDRQDMIIRSLFSRP